MIYRGEIARAILEENLLGGAKKVMGFYKDKNIWIAFDNRQGECYVEEFLTEIETLLWLNEFDTDEDITKNKIFNLANRLYFIRNLGWVFRKSNDVLEKITFNLVYNYHLN